MRRRALFVLMLGIGYVAGLLSSDYLPVLKAQQPSSRFVNVGNDGPFRVWRDNKTNQCFIVTSPYFAMLSVGPC